VAIDLIFQKIVDSLSMTFVHYTLQYTLLRLLMLLITYFKLALLACPLVLSIVLSILTIL